MVRNAVQWCAMQCESGVLFSRSVALPAPQPKTERIQLIETEVPGTNPTCPDFHHFSHIASVVGFWFVKPPLS